MRARVWNGLMIGTTPDQVLTDWPNDKAYQNLSQPNHDDSGARGTATFGGIPILLWDAKPLGPFVSLQVGIWDDDSGLGGDAADNMASMYGLWMTDQLIDQLNLMPNKTVDYEFLTPWGGAASGGRAKIKFQIKLISQGCSSPAQ